MKDNEGFKDEVFPVYYRRNGMEVISILKAYLSEEEFRGFLLGNILKYLFRFESKNGKIDILKAHTYLKWLIDEMESIERGDKK